MNKFLVIVPLILAMYTVVETAVDRAFEMKPITFKTKFFESKIVKVEKQNPFVAPSKKPSRISRTYKDVENLDFSNPKIIVKAPKKTAQKKLLKLNKVIPKDIISFELSHKKIKVTKTAIGKRSINKNIIELDIKEKVHVHAYKKISEIKKTNWSAIFEYSPPKLEFKKQAEPKQITLPALAENKKHIEVKEQYYENLATPITRQNAKITNDKKLATIKNETDRISTMQAATEKSIVSKSFSQIPKKVGKPKVIAKNRAEQEDLVFFDYSAAKKDLNTQKVAKTQVKKPRSSVVVATSKQLKPQLNFNNIGGSKNSGGSIEPQDTANKLADSKQKVTTHEPEIVELAQKFFSKQASTTQVEKPVSDNRNHKSDYSIQPYSVGLNSKISDVSQFEIRFEDDIDDIVQSFGDGEIKLNHVLNSKMATRRGTIYSSSHYPTAVDFVFENNEIIAKIPLLEKEYFNELIRKEGATGFGGQVVVELDNDTEDVNIDSNFERKLFLNKNFKVVDRSDSEYSFILFVGVEAGNSIISFKTINNKTINKIIYIGEDELYYEPNFYLDIKKDSFELFEEYLLTKDVGELNIDPKDIEGLTFQNSFSKRTSNIYGVNKVKYPIGTRSYIELKHLDESIYVGRWKSAKVIIPSEQYIRHVLDNFKIDGVGSNCLVQINLPKKAKELFYNGKSKKGVMRMQVQILDKDGIFYKDLSNESEKIFLLGQEQGTINIKVKYVDGSSDFLQSYCSDSTYLVEQL